ncbi:MAG: polysaccharide deacetylase [Legionellales bacterium]|jgi:OHCU decarboxylase|nr:polysaccharide deacetylase [Legionellales bacterium]MDG2096462.1 allantoinase PuuE [Paracoccaceae bacterium]
MKNRYPRNMSGYGVNCPEVIWPFNSRIAVQFVVNYEEGGENNILHGDQGSEAFLSEIIGATSWQGQRHWNMESIYEYGSKAGFWRLARIFQKANIKPTVFGVATALARSPEQVAAMNNMDWEIASHGLKWIEHKDMSISEERKQIKEAIKLHKEVTGKEPSGWYTGRCSMNTVDLVSSEKTFKYISDAYDDDLPYWRFYNNSEQLIIPYSLDVNDMRFASAQGFNSGDQFFTYLKDTFDCLYSEGCDGQAKIMNIGLHCRLAGRPGRAQALSKFIDYCRNHEKVWFPKRVEIADFWEKNNPPTHFNRPSQMDRSEFLNTFGGIFENSRWVAEQAFELELGPAHDTAIGIHGALLRSFRSGTRKKRLEVLKAHPDLAGKLLVSNNLTKASTSEQKSAGLNKLSEKEFAIFSTLNKKYFEKHRFPFIVAVRDYDKSGILSAFRDRLENETELEFDEACAQVERIAYIRLQDLLP